MIRRVGVLVTSLMGAGTERTILTLAAAFYKEGCEVDLYIVRDQDDYEPPVGIRCIRLHAKSNRQARISIAREVKRNGANYDLFVISNAKYYPVVPVQAKVCSVHITPTAWIKGPEWKVWSKQRKIWNLRRKFQDRPLIALSEGIYNDLTGPLKVEPSSAQVIVNPFDFEEIHTVAEEPGDIPEGPYMVCIAALIARKRHSDLLHAFSQMKNQHISLVLVGKGNEEHRLKRLASKLGVEKRVVFWGWDKNPYRIMKNAELSVLASEAEGCPRVVVESLILKTPVVSTDCPSGPSEILTGEFSQYLSPVGDVEALSRNLDNALNYYPVIPDEIVARFNSREVVKRYFSLADKLSSSDA